MKFENEEFERNCQLKPNDIESSNEASTSKSSSNRQRQQSSHDDIQVITSSVVAHSI